MGVYVGNQRMTLVGSSGRLSLVSPMALLRNLDNSSTGDGNVDAGYLYNTDDVNFLEENQKEQLNPVPDKSKQ